MKLNHVIILNLFTSPLNYQWEAISFKFLLYKRYFLNLVIIFNYYLHSQKEFWYFFNWSNIFILTMLSIKW